MPAAVEALRGYLPAMWARLGPMGINGNLNGHLFVRQRTLCIYLYAKDLFVCHFCLSAPFLVFMSYLFVLRQRISLHFSSRLYAFVCKESGYLFVIDYVFAQFNLV